MTVTLRDYQQDCLDRIDRAAARGVRRQLGVAATGLGKTVIFCALAQRMGVRTLILAHRDELIEQAAAAVRQWWPDADVGVVKGDRDETHARVVVASVQTLARPARLERLTRVSLLGPPAFGLVVVDEAHHAAAASYRAVLDGVNAGAEDGPLLLGVTATPDRGDGVGLDDLFDEVTFTYDIRWGIARGYLSDLRGLRVRLAADLSSLKVTAGDYNMGQAGRMLEDSDAPALIRQAWQAHAAGRRTLVFTPTVATARAVADEFTEHGIPAGVVDGSTPIDERRATLAAYSRGELTVLANCAVLTEGYDEPRTDCVVVARPTRSRALYTQMVGRGTRRHPDKTDCLVIDVVGVTESHDLVTIPSLFGIEKPERVWSGEATLTEALHEQIERHAVEGVLIAAEAELFAKVRTAGALAWVSAFVHGQPRRYELGMADRGRLVMVETAPDVWRAGHQERDRSKTVLIDGVPLETAQGVAEDFARMIGAGKITDPSAKWRQARPTAKQLDMCVRLKVEVPVGATKGQISELLDAAFARRAARRR
jgi:ATP-dependent helicase IRC3